MSLFTEFLGTADLVYIFPVALAGMLIVLRRIGFEMDFAGVLDAFYGDERRRESSKAYAAWRFLFPTQGLVALRVGLFVFGWATTGLTLNHVIGVRSTTPAQMLIFAGACVAGFWTTVLGTRLFHFLLPSERDTPRMEDLVGYSAVVISDTIDAEHGRARVVDARGNTITVFCRLVGDGATPQTGSQVRLVSYDSTQRTFDVTA